MSDFELDDHDVSKNSKMELTFRCKKTVLPIHLPTFGVYGMCICLRWFGLLGGEHDVRGSELFHGTEIW